jgi:hypothetical protein
VVSFGLAAFFLSDFLLKYLLIFVQGDSGGPFITEREDKKYELIGKFDYNFCC